MSSQTDSYSRDWQLLAKKFKRNPYFTLSPTIEPTLAGVLFKPALHKVIPFASVFAAFGAAAIILPLCFGIDLIATCILIPFGSLFVVGALSILLRCRQILFDSRSKEMAVFYGLYPFSKHVRLPTRDIQVQLSVNTANTAAARPGQTCIELCLPDPDQPKIRLRVSQKRASLLPTYEKLGELLSGHAVDKTLVRIQPDYGPDIEVSKTPMSPASSANFRNTRLVVRKANTALIAPTLGSRALFLFFFVMGTIGLILSIKSLFDMDIPGIFLGFIVGSVFFLIGLFGLLGKLGTKPMIFDRQQGRMIQKGQKPDIFSGTVGVPLDDIAALQICSHFESGQEAGDSYVSYQLNVILREPPGQRINLMDHGVEYDLRADAKRLAEFLNKPLLDHTADSN